MSGTSEYIGCAIRGLERTRPFLPLGARNGGFHHAWMKRSIATALQKKVSRDMILKKGRPFLCIGGILYI